MHESEINQQLTSDYNDFLNEVYDKNVPENILDLFEKAVMVLPPQSHGVNFSKVKSILSKEVYKLSVSDINDILKLIVNVSLGILYDSIDEAIPEQIKLEKFIMKYNDHIKEFQEKSNKKRVRLESLAGGVLKTNGMRIIPNSDY